MVFYEKSLSNKNLSIVNYIADVFGGRPELLHVCDPNSKTEIDILSCEGSITPDIVAFSTIGLSDYSFKKSNGEELGAGIEIAMSAYNSSIVIRDIITSCAFHAISNDWLCCPDTVLQGVIHMHRPNLELKHMLFVDPFMWEGLAKFTTEGRDVLWVHGVPISESEYVFSKEKGVEALLDLFEAQDIDTCDLEREVVC